jgi:hypothetical protein
MPHLHKALLVNCNAAAAQSQSSVLFGSFGWTVTFESFFNIGL